VWGIIDTTTERCVQEKIEWNKRIIDDTLSRRFDPLIANVILGVAAQSIALYSFFSNDNKEAREWSGKTVVYYEDYFKARRKRYGTGTWKNEAGMRHTMLIAAAFSGDRGAINAAARACLSMDSEFFAKYHDFANLYWYNQTVSHLLLGDEENARLAVKGVNGVMYESLDDCGNFDGPEQHFFGLRLSLEGILKKNEIMVRNGLRPVLKYHDCENHVDVIGPADCMVCVPAALLVMLAGMRGLVVRPDDVEDKVRKYVPWYLILPAIRQDSTTID
jgi:hypothetical protein